MNETVSRKSWKAQCSGLWGTVITNDRWTKARGACGQRNGKSGLVQRMGEGCRGLEAWDLGLSPLFVIYQALFRRVLRQMNRSFPYTMHASVLGHPSPYSGYHRLESSRLTGLLMLVVTMSLSGLY